MLRLKHVPSPPCGPVGASYETSAGLGGGRPDKAALLFSTRAHLDFLTPVSQRVSVAQAICAVVESGCCEVLGLADQEVAVLLDRRVRLRAERRRE